jgi:hypothetical protein
MLAPTYVSENSPRAIRGLLIGFYQLFETMGAMVAFFIDYGSLLHIQVRLVLFFLTRAGADTCWVLGSRLMDGSARYAVASTDPNFLLHPLLPRIAQMARWQR